MNMILFFLTFFFLYGGMHLYFFSRLKSAIPFDAATGVCVVLLLGVMLLAPFFVRILEGYGLERAARFMAYTGYFWMGLLFIFFAVSLIYDCYRFMGYLVHFIPSIGISFVGLPPLFVFGFPLLIAMGVNTYGYFEAKNPQIEKITIETARMPDHIDKIRMVQISDVHIGIIMRDQRLRGIVDAIKKADPDILVSTGDLLDGQMNNLSEPEALFKSIQPRYGKFAVTGNHEFYAGLYEAVDFMKRSGFTVLRGEGTDVGDLMTIIGVDDPAGRRFGLSREISESRLLSSFPRSRFTLLLKHQPVVDASTFGLFDLQLSGHTHKGQIFPFNVITRLFFPRHAGYFQLPMGSRLYVSRGTGTWGPPIRFLAQPEITVIELVHKAYNR